MGGPDGDRGGYSWRAWVDWFKNRDHATLKQLEIRIYMWFLICISALLIYWTFFDNSPGAEVLSLELEPSSVRAGGDLSLSAHVVRKRRCERTEIARSLIDGKKVRHILPDLGVYSVYGELGDDIVLQAVHVPETVNPGTARLVLTTAWYCNPMHQLLHRPTIRYDTKTFTILPKE